MSKAFDEQELTDQIIQGKGAKVLEDLVVLAKDSSSALSTADRERIFLLSARFFENRQKFAAGTISKEENKIEQTQINQALLQWMQDAPPEPLPPSPLPWWKYALRNVIPLLALLFAILSGVYSFYHHEPALTASQELVQQQLNELAWGKNQPALIAKIQAQFSRPVIIRVNWDDQGNFSQYTLEDYLLDLDIIQARDLIGISSWIDEPDNASVIIALIHHRHD